MAQKTASSATDGGYENTNDERMNSSDENDNV